MQQVEEDTTCSGTALGQSGHVDAAHRPGRDDLEGLRPPVGAGARAPRRPAPDCCCGRLRVTATTSGSRPVMSSRLRVKTRTSSPDRCTWTRTPSSLWSTSTGRPLLPIALCGSGALAASIGWTAVPTCRPTPSRPASPPRAARRRPRWSRRAAWPRGVRRRPALRRRPRARPGRPPPSRPGAAHRRRARTGTPAPRGWRGRTAPAPRPYARPPSRIRSGSAISSNACVDLGDGQGGLGGRGRGLLQRPPAHSGTPLAQPAGRDRTRRSPRRRPETSRSTSAIRSRLALRDRVATSARRVSVNRLSSMLAILPESTDEETRPGDCPESVPSWVVSPELVIGGCRAPDPEMRGPKLDSGRAWAQQPRIPG